jgi:hypothetical protein
MPTRSCEASHVTGYSVSGNQYPSVTASLSEFIDEDSYFLGPHSASPVLALSQEGNGEKPEAGFCALVREEYVDFASFGKIDCISYRREDAKDRRERMTHQLFQYSTASGGVS